MAKLINMFEKSKVCGQFFFFLLHETNNLIKMIQMTKFFRQKPAIVQKCICKSEMTIPSL